MEYSWRYVLILYTVPGSVFQGTQTRDIESVAGKAIQRRRHGHTTSPQTLQRAGVVFMIIVRASLLFNFTHGGVPAEEL
ncbi:hypothetical protein CLCR_04454 [Cladophialophora carrionii]|uniref:Uncharacterized protein n=1 Tax=Cladophialophora carrionii TaxID=86049 RepID=A0A1C1CJ30_9EURO|nr:hypothetical protein CLCR_04454 [Cladophialophora carrionii]